MNDHHTVVLKKYGKVSLYGDNSYGQSDLKNLPNRNIVDVATGKYDTAVIYKNGTFSVFGKYKMGNKFVRNENVKKVAIGWY